MDKLSKLENDNPKEFWNLLNELKSKNVQNDVNPDEFADYFTNLYKPHVTNKKDEVILKKLENLQENSIYVQELDKEINNTELLASSKLLKTGKSYGPDLILNEMIQTGIVVLTKPITKLFNSIIESSHFPPNWGLGYIVPLHKGGDPMDISNYRAISITSCLSKFFTLIINNRLNSFLENNDIMSIEQVGF